MSLVIAEIQHGYIFHGIPGMRAVVGSELICWEEDEWGFYRALVRIDSFTGEIPELKFDKTTTVAIEDTVWIEQEESKLLRRDDSELIVPASTLGLGYE